MLLETILVTPAGVDTLLVLVADAPVDYLERMIATCAGVMHELDAAPAVRPRADDKKPRQPGALHECDSQDQNLADTARRVAV